ncbi:MAG TPA: CHAT domain-containing tetratricopeptide repeat protein, partial [Longimicrobium sp.]|nr:CHAT domain-containing tetratricopeptide repeat protein [Longimicrobium sp.]
ERLDARAQNAARVNRAAAYLRGTTDPAAALADLAETLRGAEAVGDRRGMGTVLDIMGSVHRRAHRADSALAYHARALVLQREVDDRRGQGSTLSHIAEAYGEKGPVDSALAYYRQALQVLREVNDGRGVGSALVNIGSLYHSNPRRRNLPRAAAYYDSAAAEIAEIARASGEDPNRVSFAEKDVAMYHLWSIVWLDRTRKVGRAMAAEAALAVSERGRAQALRDLMRANASDSLHAAGAGPAHPGAGADLPAEGRALAASVTRGGTPVLSFLVTDSTLYTFLIVPGRRVEVFQAFVPQATVASMVTRVLNGLSEDTARWTRRAAGTQTRGMDARGAPPGSEREAAAAAAALADVLLPLHVRARLPASGELVIVPSGPLFRLPFAVLSLPSLPGAPSLLGLRYAIRYAPSLQVLADLEARGAVPDVTARMLVVANPTAPGISLKGAEEEGAWVDSVGRGTGVLQRDVATEDSVRARLPGATLVHLAAHAQALTGAAGARESFISLARGPLHDGKLTVAEVLDQVGEMRAEMVVLSACETGLGDVMRAEGALGFQRAFLARGARGVLVSLWSVGDKPTNLLMQMFYRNWLIDRHTKAESLRLAQMAVAVTYPDPRYWAAFQLVGAH